MVDPPLVHRTATALAAVSLWVLTAPLLGCASNDKQLEWESDVLEAQRRHDRGEYSAAERHYRRLLERADDADDRRHVRFQLARLTADRGHPENAITRYREIWSEPIDDATGARAMFAASRLLDEVLERPDEARTLRRDLIRRFPASSWAERSIESLVDAYVEREAWRELQRAFDELYRDVVHTDVAGSVLLAAGERLWRDADRPDAALAYFERILESHADSLTVDDAEWAAARIHLARQDWDRAVPVLRRLAQRVDASWLVGTLNSPHASKARYALGRLHMIFLDDYAEAIDHFERYLSDFPRNRRADDSAWHLAQAHRLAGQREGYRRALKRVIEEFPESRFVEPARRELRLVQ